MATSGAQALISDPVLGDAWQLAHAETAFLKAHQPSGRRR
jgi:hypothetical protein